MFRMTPTLESTSTLMHSSLPSSAQGVKKLLKTSKVQILVIFPIYELRFVAFTWPNLCSLDLSLLFIMLGVVILCPAFVN